MLVAAVIVGSLTGCRSTGEKMNRVSLGMTKAEVVSTMGSPDSTAANEGAEFMRYSLARASWGPEANFRDDYFVKFVNDRVVSYGRVGDFDSTKDASQTINVNWHENDSSK
jgi:outer membrane protein assembly factor BamE (lipoprotein component of BamABCDE complex)